MGDREKSEVVDVVRAMTKEQASTLLSTRRRKVFPFDTYYEKGMTDAIDIVGGVIDRRIALLIGIMDDSRDGLQYYDAYMEINALRKIRETVVRALEKGERDDSLRS